MTVSHAQNFHSHAAGDTGKKSFHIGKCCWMLGTMGIDTVYNFNSIMKTATERGSLQA